MSIPFNDHLQWESYLNHPDWFKEAASRGAAQPAAHNPLIRVANEALTQLTKEPLVRGIQFTRDALRLVLKVPIRTLWTPIWLKKNWKERERTQINAKLTGYSFVQFASVPPKFVVALAALCMMPASPASTWLLDKSAYWTAHLDGRAAQLEALKEVGRQYANNKEEYKQYKAWLYSIDPQLCCKKKQIACWCA